MLPAVLLAATKNLLMMRPTRLLRLPAADAAEMLMHERCMGLARRRALAQSRSPRTWRLTLLGGSPNGLKLLPPLRPL